MEYKDYCLAHHGVKGMKWGVRKKRREEAHEDYTRAHRKTDVRTMSDKELRETNNRLQMEKQYRDLTQKSGKGKKLVNSYIATAGLITGVIGATVTYKKLGGQALDKIGDFVVNSINLGGKWTT